MMPMDVAHLDMLQDSPPTGLPDRRPQADRDICGFSAGHGAYLHGAASRGLRHRDTKRLGLQPGGGRVEGAHRPHPGQGGAPPCSAASMHNPPFVTTHSATAVLNSLDSTGLLMRN